jgi:membrane peptidoglycan carboxypeptidase
VRGSGSTIAQQLVKILYFEPDRRVAAARELGIDGSLQETPSLILGASEVSLLDLTGAYASIRGSAAPIEPYAIKTFQAPNGRPFTIGPSVAPSVNLADTQAAMHGLLQLVVERGTGQEAQLDRFAAGKTGTSQDYRDAWFVGFDENFTVGVWVGNDDSSPMEAVTGGQLPARIWSTFMRAAAPPASDTLLAPPASEAPQDEPSGRTLMDLIQSSTGADDAPAFAQCNIQQCAASYRSFRASDCTFQPYRGPRRLCEK